MFAENFVIVLGVFWIGSAAYTITAVILSLVLKEKLTVPQVLAVILVSITLVVGVFLLYLPTNKPIDIAVITGAISFFGYLFFAGIQQNLADISIRFSLLMALSVSLGVYTLNYLLISG